MDEGSIGSNEILIPNEESLLNTMNSNVTFNKFSLYVKRLGSLQECGRMKGQSQYESGHYREAKNVILEPSCTAS